MQINEQAQAHFRSAVEAHQRGDLGGAEQHYRDVLALQPTHPAACNNLGLCLAMSGRLDEATGWFRRARSADPTSGDPVVNLAQALQQAGQLDEALATWREAAALLEDHMEPALASAMLAASLGRLDEAIDDLTLAAARNPRRDASRERLIDQVGELAAQCVASGDLARGHRLSSLLVRLAPADGTAVHLLEDCLRHARIVDHDEALRDDLLRYFRSDAVEHHELSRVTGELLCATYPALAGGDPGDDLAAWTGTGIQRDDLLERLLTRGRVATASLERSLTTLRRALARVVRHDSFPDDDWRRFATALALQCFTNEYVFQVTAAEEDWCASFEARIDRDPLDLDALVALACFRSPADLPHARHLAGTPVPAHGLLAELRRRTLIEPLEERALRQQLDAPPMADAVSAAVREQYEESPYPRWQNLERQPAMEVAQFLSHELPHHSPASGPDGAAPILIAGCGTGEHALRVATRHPMCTVIAVDLSTASLAYGQRKAAELGIGNITFEHRDILSITAEDGPFQLIESVGVLHHMNDPAAGLTALRDALAEHGVMKLGLYSRRARRIVTLARERIAALALETTPAGMRTLRGRILDGREPSLEPLLHSLDFYAMSTIRDLLFHVQEHQFDVPGLRALLERCGLRCIGFQVSPTTRARYLQRYPEDPAMLDLDNWAALENEYPHTFAGMYQFWCQRPGDSRNLHAC